MSTLEHYSTSELHAILHDLISGVGSGIPR